MVYLASLLVGSGVGIVYGLIGLRSPAPPVAALLGLLGMLAGEHAVATVKHIIAHRGGTVASSDVASSKADGTRS